jgi:Xaa-Pro dipeptidase
MDIFQIQQKLKELKIDGWLLFDDHGSNKFARNLLNIQHHVMLTRRFFYWIPKEGEPEKIVHAIEGQHLDFLPGNKHFYLSLNQLKEALKRVLKSAKTVAMEYSKDAELPQVSVIDAGTFELVEKMGVNIVSSALLLLFFTNILDETQINSHRQAALILKTTVEKTWEFIGKEVRLKKKITDYEVQQFIVSELIASDCLAEDPFICAVNEYSALPHYTPSKSSPKVIYENDFILLDLWCKKRDPQAIYADITRVGVIGKAPTNKQEEIFNIVRAAQQEALDLIANSFKEHRPVFGSEVDDAARSYIAKKGYGAFFTHRTGHNIDTQLHGSGTNMDHFETEDHRPLIAGSCFSIEPGIYLPSEFGVRLETNVLIHHNGSIEITGVCQDEILHL